MCTKLRFHRNSQLQGLSKSCWLASAQHPDSARPHAPISPPFNKSQSSLQNHPRRKRRTWTLHARDNNLDHRSSSYISYTVSSPNTHKSHRNASVSLPSLVARLSPHYMTGEVQRGELSSLLRKVRRECTSGGEDRCPKGFWVGRVLTGVQVRVEIRRV